jgi:hypothetical protein
MEKIEMTTLPLRLTREPSTGQWWIVDRAGEREAGPYDGRDGKREAEEDRVGLTKFYEKNPGSR